MNNKEYFEILKRILEELKELRDEGLQIARNIVGERLAKEDMFFCASLDRCLNLLSGFSALIKERNLTCVGAILRLQMDNCLRTHAAFIAENGEEIVDCLIYETQINKRKDFRGNRLTDGYLKDELSKKDERFAQVYDQASGFIHLSDKALYQAITDIDDSGKVTLQIGHSLPEKMNDSLIEYANAFCHYVRLHYEMLNTVTARKRECVAKIPE